MQDLSESGQRKPISCWSDSNTFYMYEVVNKAFYFIVGHPHKLFRFPLPDRPTVFKTKPSGPIFFETSVEKKFSI